MPQDSVSFPSVAPNDASDALIYRDGILDYDAPDAKRRIQYARAEDMASALCSYDFNPRQWQAYFNILLKQTRQFDRQFEEAR